MDNTPKETAVELLKKELPTIKAIMSLNAKEGVDVETMALQELEYLKMQALTKPDILECLPQSIIIAVKSVLKQNLTMDPYTGLVYIKTRGVKVGNEYKKALEIMPSANGLISIARQCGRILDVKRPYVTKDDQGKVTGVVAEFLLPTVGGHRWEKYEFEEDDFMRWRIASHKENSRGWSSSSGKTQPNIDVLNYANPNYTNWKGGMDPEFARAKAIRHALKKLGTNPNEQRVQKIDISDNKIIVINPDADRNAAFEEANEFIQNAGDTSEIPSSNEL